MKRKELDRRISQLLDRIDGELAEIRDGLIEVDHRAAASARGASGMLANLGALDRRIAELERCDQKRLADFLGSHSRRVDA